MRTPPTKRVLWLPEWVDWLVDGANSAKRLMVFWNG
jgi:hypothetical protein